jgi:hypothetical protein
MRRKSKTSLKRREGVAGEGERPFERLALPARVTCAEVGAVVFGLRVAGDAVLVPVTGVLPVDDVVVSFSARAVARSVPNGFSRMTVAFSARPEMPSIETTPPNATGGTER